MKMIRLALLHIPKTAGTSIITAMRTVFEGKHFLDKDLDQRLFGAFGSWKSMSQGLRERILLDEEIAEHKDIDYDVAMGHFSLDTLLELGADKIVTIFREPRVRILSHYFYLKSWTEDMRVDYGEYEHIKKMGYMTIGEIMEDETSMDQIDNMQARMILPKEMVPKNQPLDRLDEMKYRDAIEARLDNFQLSGCIENIEEFTAGLSILLTHPLNIQHLNATNTKSENGAFTQNELSLLGERTWLDSWLYDRIAEKNEINSDEKSRDEIFMKTIRKYGISM